MTNFEKLTFFRNKNNGMLKTGEIFEYGVPKPVFYKYVKENNMDKVAPGIFLAKDKWVDLMYIYNLRFKEAIFSHETALFLHNLTDREPSKYSLTVKTGYNPTIIKNEGIKVFTIKKELLDVGIVMLKTPFGNDVRVYDMERTICDLIRSRSQIEIQSLQMALKQYIVRKDKDLRKLMKYAKLFKVEKILRQYLEVLL